MLDRNRQDSPAMAALEPFGDGLWLADGPAVSFVGIPYPTRMAVVKLASGGLWIWSPIARSEALAAEVEALGPVEHLVSPNALHHLFLGAWKKACPEATMWASPRLRRRRRDLAFDADLEDEPPPAWAGEIDQVVVRGSPFLEEVLFFHRASRTVLVCDLVQRFEPGSIGGWRESLMQAWGLVGDRGSTPREWRASFLRRRPARQALETALSWEPERLVVAHGRCATSDGAAALATGLRWLRPRVV